MTKEGLARVLGYAVADANFRKRLKEDPEEASHFAGLSRKEIEFLKRDKVLDDLEEFAGRVKVKYDPDTQLGENKRN
jgi:hypothetical protein